MRRFFITTIVVLLLIPLGMYLASNSQPTSEQPASPAIDEREEADTQERENPCADDPGFCYQQAIEMADSPDLELSDFPKLRELFGDACDAGWALACQDLALMAEQGIGEEVDLERALKFYQMACDLGHGLGCASAQILQDGDGGQDWGPELWFERCTEGDVDDCIQLGFYLDDGGELEVELTARDVFEAACDELHDSACFWLARHLEAHDVKIPDNELDELYQRACAIGVGGACSVLASRLEDRSTDITQVIELMEKACEHQDGHGCYYLGLYRAESDSEAAIRAWQTGCEVWHGESCNQLALAIVREDRDQAGEYFERACMLDIPSACYNFGVHLNLTQSPPPFERTRQLFDRACQGEHFLACAFLANMYRNGQGGPVDLSQAAELAALACQNGIEMACE